MPLKGGEMALKLTAVLMLGKASKTGKAKYPVRAGPEGRLNRSQRMALTRRNDLLTQSMKAFTSFNGIIRSRACNSG